MKPLVALGCLAVAAGAFAEVKVVERTGPDMTLEGSVAIKSPLILEYRLEELFEPFKEDLSQYDIDTAIIRSFKIIPHRFKYSLLVNVDMVVYVKEGHDRTMSLSVEALSDGEPQVLVPVDYFEAEETKVTSKRRTFTIPRKLYEAEDVKIVIKIAAKEDGT